MPLVKRRGISGFEPFWIRGLLRGTKRAVALASPPGRSVESLLMAKTLDTDEPILVITRL